MNNVILLITNSIIIIWKLLQLLSGRHYLNCLILILFRSDILKSARSWNESTSNFTIIKMESPKQYFCSMLSSLLSVDGYIVSPPIMIDYGIIIKGLHSVMQFRCLNNNFFLWRGFYDYITQQSSIIYFRWIATLFHHY